jgi:hypothetical protein
MTLITRRILLLTVICIGIASCDGGSDFKGQSAANNKRGPKKDPLVDCGLNILCSPARPDRPDLIPEGLGQDCQIVKNLIENSDFEKGNVGFTSQFTYDSSCKGQYSPHPALHYSVNRTVNGCHNGYASNADDRGNMLVVNFPAAGQAATKFWCQNIEVTAGRLYKISTRVRAAVPASVLTQPTSVAFTANGQGFTANGAELIPQFHLEADWKEYTAVLSPAVSGLIAFCAEARTQNTESTDLVMDDIIFGECQSY